MSHPDIGSVRGAHRPPVPDQVLIEIVDDLIMPLVRPHSTRIEYATYLAR
ncbi:MAG: hypothetical protein WCC65_01205 [Pseudonocardiaceae bacterium]